MTRKIIQKRTRFFFAVEGEGEQSFIKWVGQCSEEINMNLHLDCQVLGGGGYEAMLQRAGRYREIKDRFKAKTSILLLDADRADKDDAWSVNKLKQEAKKFNFEAIFQCPNQEGVLLKMLLKDDIVPKNASSDYVHRSLVKLWPDYKKPVDARTLSAKFSLSDLQRVARTDMELQTLITILGLGV